MLLKLALRRSIISSLFLLLASGSSAPAAVVAFTFSTLSSSIGGPFDGSTGSGSFSYDNALLDSGGDGTFAPVNGLTVSLTMFGQTFTEADDLDFNLHPQLTVVGFVPFSFDFIIMETPIPGANSVSIAQPGVNDIAILGELAVPPGGGVDFEVESFVNAIPEPSQSLLLLLALGALLIRRPRQG